MTSNSLARLILPLLTMAPMTGCATLSAEHREARSLSISNISFSSLPEGQYTGQYPGGRYQWRACRVEVTVHAGRVQKITMLHSVEKGRGDITPENLYNRVIEAQSLQVDTLTGATLTSRAWLKAVEQALINAATNSASGGRI